LSGGDGGLCHIARAREIAALGHEVRMMPARYVKPNIKDLWY
jgi:transposase